MGLKYWSKICVLLLAYLFAVIANSLEHPVKTENKTDTATLEIIKSEAEKLTENSFVNDPVFVQVVDRVNSETKYRAPMDRHFSYVRSGDDSKQNVVVLTDTEDKLKFKKKKKLYVVLKKKTPIEGDTNVYYYATLAFIRLATPNDTNAIVIDGKKHIIEWDLWDDHLLPGGSTQTSETFFCVYSFLAPCFQDDSELLHNTSLIKSPHYIPKKESEDVIKAASSEKYQVEDGVDQNDNLDFYMDMDTRLLSAVGRSTPSTIGGRHMISAAANIACGVFSVIGVCGRRKKEKETVQVVTQIIPGQPQYQQQQEVFNPYPGGIGIYPGSYPGVNYPLAVEAYPGAPIPGVAISPGAYGRRRRAAVNETTINSLDYPGWKTQFKATVKGVYINEVDKIFYGFGNCPYRAVGKSDLEKANSDDEIIDFFLTVLRTDCVTWMKEYILHLIREGFMVFKDKSLIFVLPDKLSPQPKLNLKELLQLSSAAELCAFTHAYNAEIKTPSPRNVYGDKISKSIEFFLNIALKLLDKVRQYTRLHSIRLTRNILHTSKAIYLKLQQDQQNLEKCADCKEDLKINFNDKTIMMSLKWFIKTALEPLDKGKKSAQPLFKLFHTKNRKSMEEKVKKC